MRNGIFHLVTGMAVAVALSASPASAQKKYDTGERSRPEVPQRKKSAAVARLHRRVALLGSAKRALDHRLQSELPVGSPHLREVYSEESPRRQDQHPVPER